MPVSRVLALAVLGSAAIALDSATAQTTAPRLILIPSPLSYEFQQERGTLEAAPGKRFLGIALTKTDTVQVRFLADSAILSVGPDEQLRPAGFCSDSLGKECIPIALLHAGQIIGAYGKNGEGYSLVKNAKTGLVTLARRGPKGTPFVLLYEVPVDAKQLTFTFGATSGVTLTLRPTDG